MDKNLFERIKDYQLSKPIRFHVPSHKGYGNDLQLYGMDITELDFSDNLNVPSDIIQNEEKIAAKIFGAGKTIFSMNGASAAVMSAVMASVKQGEKLLLPFNSHISCYYGAIHSDADIVRLRVKDTISGVSYNEVETAIKENQNIKVCVITNPTYYGCCTDIKKICLLLKNNGIIAIVDESHGTHFEFSADYPVSALQTDADIVIHSGHKTINGLTQTGLIHLLSDRIKEEDIRFHMRMLQSTSPSYILLLSLINAVNELNTVEHILFNIKLWYNNINKDMLDSTFFQLLNYKKYLDKTAYDFDPLKLCISISNTKITGYQLMKDIQDRYNIYGEMAESNLILFAAGLHSKEEDFLMLRNALNSFERTIQKSTNNISKQVVFHVPKRIMPIKEAARSDYEYFSINDCEGKISADFISIYPPGSPFILPGEIIDKEACKLLSTYPAYCITGISNNKIKTVKR